MANPIPTFSTSGWISDITQKADALLAYFFVNDRSQTNNPPGGVQSLPYILQSEEVGPRLTEAVEMALGALYRAYFDDVDVTVTLVPIDPGNDSRLDMKISLMVTQAGRKYSLGKLIDYSGNRINKVTNLNG